MKRSYGGVTTTYVFSGTKPIAEYVGGTVTREYIYSGQTQLAEIAYSGLNVSVTYKYPDHLSTRDETDASGNLTRTFGHLPFGETWYETGTSSKWKFTTYERDAETNNDYGTFRYHENRIGRFMTTDPYNGSTSPLLPQTWNKFAYVMNQPVDFFDPLGLCVKIPFMVFDRIENGLGVIDQSSGHVVDYYFGDDCVGGDGHGHHGAHTIALPVSDESSSIGSANSQSPKKPTPQQCQAIVDSHFHEMDALTNDWFIDFELGLLSGGLGCLKAQDGPCLGGAVLSGVSLYRVTKSSLKQIDQVNAFTVTKLAAAGCDTNLSSYAGPVSPGDGWRGR